MTYDDTQAEPDERLQQCSGCYDYLTAEEIALGAPWCERCQTLLDFEAWQPEDDELVDNERREA